MCVWGGLVDQWQPVFHQVLRSLQTSSLSPSVPPQSEEKSIRYTDSEHEETLCLSSCCLSIIINNEQEQRNKFPHLSLLVGLHGIK